MKLQHPSQKVAIIGAGPAGILAGLELQKAGYEDITVYGKFEEAQCRTKHIDGVVADVGTCYVHSGYFNTIKRLVKDYDIHIKYLETEAKSVNSTDIHQAILPTTNEKILTYLGLVYFLLHSVFWKLFKNTFIGRYIYGISFEKYMNRVGLGKLANSIVFGPGCVAQGYGFLKDVSAYRLFRWFRPSIFVTPIMNKRQKGTGIIAEGYGTLFKKAYDSLPNHQEVYIKSVIPIADNQLKITDKNGQTSFYDIVVVACPLSKVKTPISFLIQEHHVQSTPLFSYLWTSNKASHFGDRVYILDHINSNKTDVISTFRLWGKTNAGLYLYWGVGYASGKIDSATLKQKLEKQAKNELELPVQTCDFFEVFDYNVRFSASAIRQGLHKKIQKAQGANNIWYSGGMLSHWDVDSIYEFDIQLANQLVYHNNKSLANFFKYIFVRVKGFFVNV